LIRAQRIFEIHKTKVSPPMTAKKYMKFRVDCSIPWSYCLNLNK
jgi:gamma-glutamylcysteine synthetase